MTDEEILDRAFNAIEPLSDRVNVEVFNSVKAQLRYLRDALRGANDGSRLKDIILGVQAAKEFDGQPEIADPLHDAAEIRNRLLFSNP